MSNVIHPDAFELAELLRPSWPTMSARLRAERALVAEGFGQPAGLPESGQGGQGQGAAGEGQGGEGEGGAEGAVDPRVLERMDGMEQNLGQMMPVLQQMAEHMPALQQALQGEGGGEGGEADPLESLMEMLSGGGEGDLGDGLGEPAGQTGLDPQALIGAFRQVVQQELQGVRGELGNVTGDLQRRDLDALEQSLPGLQDPNTKKEVVQRVVETAELFAGGQEQEVQRLMRNPAFVRMVYFSRVGEQGAASETPAGAETGDVVEGASGASAGQAAGGSDVDPGDAIVGASQRGGWGRW